MKYKFKFLLPFRLKFVYRVFRNKPFRLLDVGSGNRSPSITKKWLPRCEYYGIDRSRHYGYTDEDFQAMTRFYEMDLTRLDFGRLPDGFFDVIIMSHILEHLDNGVQVLERLLHKVRGTGCVYIEFPGRRSTRLPHMKGTLNFYDDSTHCRIYSLEEIENVLVQNQFAIARRGIRRDLTGILLIPWRLVRSRFSLGYVSGSVFWDLLGFAYFVFAKRESC